MRFWTAFGHSPQFVAKPSLIGIVDRRPCHATSEVPMAAARVRMRLVFVPRGGTGRHQPIDLRIFGVLDRNQRQLYDDAHVAGMPWHGMAWHGRAWAGRRQTRSGPLPTHGSQAMSPLPRALGEVRPRRRCGGALTGSYRCIQTRPCRIWRAVAVIVTHLMLAPTHVSGRGLAFPARVCRAPALNGPCLTESARSHPMRCLFCCPLTPRPLSSLLSRGRCPLRAAVRSGFDA